MSTAWSAARSSARPASCRYTTQASWSSGWPGASMAASRERFSSSTWASSVGSRSLPGASRAPKACMASSTIHTAFSLICSRWRVHLRLRGAPTTTWPSRATLTAMSPMRSRCRLTWRIAVSRRRSEATGAWRPSKSTTCRSMSRYRRSTSWSPATTAPHRAALPVTNPRVARARATRTRAPWACTSASRCSRVSWKRSRYGRGWVGGHRGCLLGGPAHDRTGAAGALEARRSRLATGPTLPTVAPVHPPLEGRHPTGVPSSPSPGGQVRLASRRWHKTLAALEVHDEAHRAGRDDQGGRGHRGPTPFKGWSGC